jgi:hypothetical protein
MSKVAEKEEEGGAVVASEMSFNIAAAISQRSK